MPDAPTHGTINLFGKKVKTQTVLLGAGSVIVVAVGIGYYRSKKAASSAAAANAATTSANDIDPATGFPSGSPQDEAALAGMSEGDLGLGGNTSTGAGEIIGYDGVGNPIYAAGTTSIVGGFTSNAQWGQAAEQYLGSNGSDAIAAAIAKYLSGQPVTSDQVTLVQEAIAVEGNPPVAGTNGNPPGYLTAPPAAGTPTGGTGTTTPPPTGTGTGTGTGTTSPTSVKVPYVIGLRAEKAGDDLTAV
jgi:hypothetical protein